MYIFFWWHSPKVLNIYYPLSVCGQSPRGEKDEQEDIYIWRSSDWRGGITHATNSDGE